MIGGVLQDLVAWAAIISAVCAVVAAAVSVKAWRKTESKDLTAKIEKGDQAVKLHADSALIDIRKALTTQSQRLAELEDGQARIEVNQKQHLIARDLGPIHEKINAVATDLAANAATTRAIHEQLRMIQQLLMRREP